jgi:hypothetical protein
VSRFHYVATPDRGRIGRSRNVQPFRVGGGEHRGNIDAIVSSLALGLKRWLGLRAVLDIVVRPVADSTNFEVQVFDKSNACVARLTLTPEENAK